MAAPPSDGYSDISLRVVRALAVKGWAVGIVIACLLMIPAPPTAQIGAWGWLAGGAVQAASLAALIVFRRRKAAISFGALFVVTWALPADLAVMQWLGGGWDAPYHELLLPALILGSAGLPPSRFAPFASFVAAIALLPALYAPDADGLLHTATELTIWMFVASTLSMVMARVRGQARLARQDELTRLANRRALDERFSAPRTGSVTLGIGDLNGFKGINDRHGHLAGDECLARVGAVLEAHARAGDQVFRWGGDEFAVLLPETAEADAARVFERLEAAVTAEVRDPEGRPVGVTFGWAAGGPEVGLQSLTAAADADLLKRKPSRQR